MFIILFIKNSRRLHTLLCYCLHKRKKKSYIWNITVPLVSHVERWCGRGEMSLEQRVGWLDDEPNVSADKSSRFTRECLGETIFKGDFLSHRCKLSCMLYQSVTLLSVNFTALSHNNNMQYIEYFNSMMKYSITITSLSKEQCKHFLFLVKI